MLGELAGRTHRVVSGLCLLGDGFAVVEHAVTSVTFRDALRGRDRRVPRARASGADAPAATRSRASAPVSSPRIDGDYLNVVGLPAALLIDALAAHVPNLLQIRRG